MVFEVFDGFEGFEVFEVFKVFEVLEVLEVFEVFEVLGVFEVQKSQSRRGALSTNGNGVRFPIQHSQSRKLNPGGVRNPGVVHFPNPYNILIMSL